MKRNFWTSLVVLTISIGYLLIFVFPHSSAINNTLDRFGERRVFVMQGQINPFRVDFEIAPPPLDDPNQFPTIEVMEMYYIDTPEVIVEKNISKICVDKLIVLVKFASSWGGPQGDEIGRFFTEGVCKEVDLSDKDIVFVDLYTADGEQDQLIIGSWVENQNYYYPYDGFSYQIGVLLRYSLVDQNNMIVDSNLVAPYVIIQDNKDTEWDGHAQNQVSNFSSAYWLLDDEYIEFAEESLETPYLIQFSRPILKRIVYPIILASLFIFISMLASASELNIFIEGAIAILLAIFGIREVIIPNNLPVRTILDIAILGLYLSFSAAVFVQLIRNFFRYRTRKLENEIKTSKLQPELAKVDNKGDQRVEQLSWIARRIYNFFIALIVVGILIVSLMIKIISKLKNGNPTPLARVEISLRPWD